MKNFNILFTDVKGFMANEVNRVFVLFTVVNIFLALFIHFDIQSLKNNYISLENSIIKTQKKVDYRYFNLTRSLEDIHNIKIDTQSGEIKKSY